MKCPSCGTDVPRQSHPSGPAPAACPRCGALLPATGGERTIVAGDAVVPSRVGGDARTLADAGPATVRALPAAGAVFAGYEVLELLGRGGMGAVYRARRSGSSRDVALKVLLAGEQAGEEDRARFRREAQVVGDLRHPGIVAVHDVGEDGGCPYYTMDLVAGPSLSRRIRDEGPLPVREAMTLVRDLALALEHAHAHGIVHRDLKPANVLLVDGRRPVLTDFGIARRLGATRLTRTGAVLGTPAYMAPEQAEGDAGEPAPPPDRGQGHASPLVSTSRIGPHTDVYSLGAILYETLTAHVPFEGDTELAIVYMVLNREPIAPRVWRPDLPVEAELICLKAMDKEIPRRYATARDLAEDLDRWLRGEPVVARPLSRGARAARFLRRRRREAMVGALGLGLALAAAGWGLVASRQAAEERAARERQERVAEEERREAAARKAAGDEAFQTGMRLYSTRRYSEALARFEAAVRLDPAFETAHLNRAQLLRELGRASEARAAYEETTRVLPRSSTAWHQLGSLLHGEGKLAEAVDAFSHAIEIEPEHGMAFANRGFSRIGLGDLDRALEDLDRAIALDDRYAEAWLRRGILWRERKEWDAARRDHDRALELEPGLAEHWYQRALLRVRCGEFAGALEDAARAEERGLRTADLFLVAAQAQHGLRRLEEAAALLARALERDPGHVGALVQAGFVLNDLGRPEKALPLLERAAERDPNHAAAWLNLGNAHLLLDRAARAEACYDRSLALEPGGAKALSNRGMARHRLGKGEGAREDAEAAMKADPAFGAPHVILGLVLAAAGRHAEARAEFGAARRLGVAGFEDQVDTADAWSAAALGLLEEAVAGAERALARNPGSADGLRARAESLLRLGRTDAALSAIEDWIGRRPDDGAAWFGRGWLRLTQGRAAEAAEDFARARSCGHDPQDWSTLQRARALADSGRGDEALAEIEPVLIRDPGHAVAHQVRGVVLLRLGRLEEADASIERFSGLTPASPHGPYNRACVAARAGRIDDAFAWLEKAVALGYDDGPALEGDDDLASLRGDPRFVALRARLKGNR